MYETHALNSNLTLWSDPVSVSVNETNVYDPKMFKIGSTYYMWLANQTTRYVEYASSANLLGPYTMQQTGNWAGWGNWREGAMLYQPTPSSWRAGLEDISAGAGRHVVSYSDCNNADFTLCVWTPLQPWHEDQKYRHGSILVTP
jgi:hypothetical protein